MLAIMAILFVGGLSAQKLTVSAYSRYAIGEILDFTTTRNAGMGGLSIATDNFFSVNNVNPAALTDVVYTTMDISSFGQFNRFNTEQGSRSPFTAGFQNLSFAFPGNKGPVLSFGFAPYSAVGYDIRESKSIVLDTTSYIQNLNISGEGGLNQVFAGIGFKALNKKLRIGLSARYLFGNTLYTWDHALITEDSLLVGGLQAVSLTRDVYIDGLATQAGLMWVDTLNKEKARFIRFGATADYTFGLRGDRYLARGEDSIRTLEVGTIQVPLKLGAGIMINQLGKWSLGADFTFQDWSQLKYFSDTTNLGPEFKVSLGGEFMPNFGSPKYVDRIAYRFGAYYKQTYIVFDDVPLNDYGITFGIGLPAGSKGNNRFNRGRASSRISLSFALGRRGSLAAGLPAEEYYGRIRLGFNLNERWFVRRVVD